MQQIYLDGAEFQQALAAAARDAASIFVGARGSEGAGLWPSLVGHADKLQVCLGGEAGPALVRALAGLPSLKHAPAPNGALHADVVVCDSPSKCQAFLGYGALAAVEGDPCLVVGLTLEPSSPSAEKLRRLMQIWTACTTVVTADELGRILAGAPRGLPLARLASARKLERLLDPELRLKWLTEFHDSLVAGSESAIVLLGDERFQLPVQRFLGPGWWLGIERLEDRFRFLLGPVDTSADELRAEVEFSVPLDPNDHRYAGMLARDASTGAGVLAHRGVLRKGPRSINEQFWKNTRCQKLEVWDPEAEEELRVALVTALDLPGRAEALVAFALEVQRVRQMFEHLESEERDDRPSVSEFTEQGEEAQVGLVWDALIGSGPLELEDAVRTASRSLREQGYVSYQRLRRGGAVFTAIEGAIGRGIRAGRFDRPRRLHVRAILPEADQFPREYWRDCLLNALPAEPIDRESAMRAAADYAVDYYGLQHQRLRRGGRVERGIKSAINSAIRQGFVRRIGAGTIQLLPPTEQLVDVAQDSGVATEQSVEEPVSATAAPTTVEAPSAEPGTEQSVEEPVSATAASTTVEAPSAEPGAADGQATASPDVHEPAPPEPSPSEQASDQPALHRPLTSLDLPTRTFNWAEQVGVHTIGELLAWHPDVFAAQRNIGRRSVRETRAALEQAVGQEWEDAWRALEGPKQTPADAPPESTEAPASASGVSAWDRALSSVPEAFWSTPLIEIELPSRMRAYCEQHDLTTIEQLLAQPGSTLTGAPNLGRTSLKTTLAAVADFIDQAQRRPEDSSFMDGWRRRLQALEPMLRLIVSRRAGVMGEPETLESLGEMLGVTRERVRQLEARAVESLGRQRRWLSEVRTRLDAALAGSRSLPLDLLEEDPWWRGMRDHLATVRYLFSRVLDGQYHVVEINGEPCVASFDQATLEGVRSGLHAQVRELAFPVRLEAVHELIGSATKELGGPVRELLTEEIEEQFVFDPADRYNVLGSDRNRTQEVLAFLRGAPEPVRVAEIEERFGRGHLPDGVLFFKRGLVGLRQHFPDFEAWQARLVPRCIEIMKEGPPGRQWLVPELWEAVGESVELPDWLKHWPLASLLRESDQVRYLGRLRVSLLDEGASAERIQVADHLYDLLQEAGRPLPLDELRALATRATDIAEGTLRMTLLYSPFVKLDGDSHGLLERDVPGGAASIAEAADAVVERLEQSQKGLTAFQAEQLVLQLSTLHAGWSPQLVASVLRNEPRLHVTRAGGIGLSDWDDVRAPTRAGLLRRLVDERGSISVAHLNEELTALFGKPLAGPALLSECAKLGLHVENDRIRAKSSDSAPPPSRALSESVVGIPAEAKQLFEELLNEPELPVERLQREITEHVEDFEREFQVNEFADINLAKQLAEQCLAWLSRWPEWSPEKRRVAQAGVRYFVIPEDGEDDFGIGGLSDDQQVLRAVGERLGS